MVSLLNRRIGGYLLDSQIGAGAVGTVFRAKHPSGRVAAIKVVHAELTRERAFAERFARVAGASRLSHPYAIPVEEIGESDGQYFIRMALVENGSLRTLLERRAELPLSRRIDYLRQVAEVLAYAHGRGVLHRDLKPENVLLGTRDSAGVAESVAVVDWGLTQLVDTGVTVVGSRSPGSPRYMSPEQIKGVGTDHRSDLYSLGVVLYEAATGLPPFKIDTLAEAFEKHVTTPPPPPRSVAPEIPAALESLILRCLAKAPDQRFQSAEEVAAELRQMAGPVVAPRPRIHVHLGDPGAAGSPPPAERGREKPERKIVWRGEEGEKAPAAPPTPANVPADPRGRVHVKGHGPDLDAGPTLPADLGQKDARGAADKVARPASRSKRIQIVLDRTTLVLVPDQPVVLRVTLLNAGKTTEHFPLTIEGVPASWVQIPRDPPQLNPQERITVGITVRVPKTPENRAGTYTATVRARSLLHPDEFTTAPGEWTVLPFAAPSLSLTPTRATTWRRSTFTLHAHNGGNAPARFVFGGTDDEQSLRFDFVDDSHLQLDNGQSADVRVRVRGKMRWFGGADTRTFTLRAEPVALTDGHPPAAMAPAVAPAVAMGQFVRRAVIPTWAPPVLALVALGGLLAIRDRNTVALRLTPGHVQVEETGVERVVAEVTNKKVELLPDQSVVWSTRDTSIAVVSDSGLIQGRKPGKTVLVVSHGRVSESTEIEVVAGQAESVTVDPPRLVLSRGQSRALRATARDAAGKRIQRTPRWESSDPLVATVGGDGRVVAKDSGLATITARIGEKFASTTVTVLAPPARATAGGDAATAAGGDGDCTVYDPGSLKVHKLDGNEGFAVAADPANPVLTLDTESDARRGLSLARGLHKIGQVGRTNKRHN